jgi:PadR family transcriptional regulator, regulatory protein PadR
MTSSNNLDSYEQKLLTGWEEVFKKGQLTMWIMLSLKEGPKHMAEMKNFITKYTRGTLEADDQSMYRALRRYYDAELIDFTLKPGENGPDLKVYALSPIGHKVLEAFLTRNIRKVYYQPTIKQLIEKGV